MHWRQGIESREHWSPVVSAKIKMRRSVLNQHEIASVCEHFLGHKFLKLLLRWLSKHQGCKVFSIRRPSGFGDWNTATSALRGYVEEDRGVKKIVSLQKKAIKHNALETAVIMYQLCIQMIICSCQWDLHYQLILHFNQCQCEVKQYVWLSLHCWKFVRMNRYSGFNAVEVYFPLKITWTYSNALVWCYTKMKMNHKKG